MKLISLTEKCLKKIGRLCALIFRLNHKNSDNFIDETLEAIRTQVRAPKLKNVLVKFRELL